MKTRKYSTLTILALSAATFMPLNIMAVPAPQSANLAVTATVSNSCTALAATTLPFGTIDPTTTGDIKVTPTVSVTCTKGAVVVMALDKGSTTGAAFTQRLMTNGTTTLKYNIYTDNTYGTVFGDSTGSTKTVSQTSTNAAVPLTYSIFGRILAADIDDATAGSYNDTVKMTITY